MPTDRLRFSANLSMLFTEVALPERFRLAREYGFSAVEIQFPYSHDAALLQDCLRENHLQLVLFNVDADDLLQGGEGLAAVPEKRGRFKAAVAQALDYAQLLRPQVINVLPGRCLDSRRLPEYRQTFLENLSYALDAFHPLGIKTVFEAINDRDMPGFIIHTGRQMLDVLAEIGHPGLQMQYDIYHMRRMDEDVSAFITEHAAGIGHIQFADVPGRGQPGTGSIDFPGLFAAIAASGYSGWLGAEYIPKGCTTNSLAWLETAHSI